MTRTISIITATVGAVLVFALPAYGDSWGADKAQPTGVTSPDWFERKAAVAIEKQRTEMLNARERGLGTPTSGPQLVDLLAAKNGVVDSSIVDGSTQAPVDPRSDGLNRLYGLGEYANPIDSRERALVAKSQVSTPQPQPAKGFDARSDGLNRMYGLGDYAPAVVADDRFRIDYSDVPVSVQPTSTGTEFEWPQVGVGLGIALALILGLVLTLKATHTRPFAH